VDANIIINERIKEELGRGLTIKSAIKLGYENAFSSVFDGNITVLIVALILMFGGAGGAMFSFGYTLLIGIIFNFVAGVWASHMLFNSLVQYPEMQNNKLYGVAKEKKIRKFYEKRYIPFIVSGVLLVGGGLSLFIRPAQFDTQFTGGALLKYTYEGDINVDEIDEYAGEVEALRGRPVTAQILEDAATQQKRLSLEFAGREGLSPETQKALETMLNERMPDAKIALSESKIVEPYIGDSARNKALWSIAIAFVLIVLYVWFSFRSVSGLSAGVMGLVALFHDVLIAFFAFTIFGLPLGDSFVAVILAIVGYSINDTIVIYDRVRENRKLHPKAPFNELINQSVSQTMGRSLGTNFCVTLSVLLMMICAVIYGLDSIKTFAIPMFFGTISGCYSTIFLAGPLWASWKLRGAKSALTPNKA
jgi:SecD/SecF fusion protein